MILSVPLDELRDWMLGVHTEEMYQGEYVFIYVNQQTVDQSLYNNITSRELWETGDGNDNKVRQAMENLFLVITVLLGYMVWASNMVWARICYCYSLSTSQLWRRIYTLRRLPS